MGVSDAPDFPGEISEPEPKEENVAAFTSHAFAEANRQIWDTPEEDTAWADWQASSPNEKPLPPVVPFLVVGSPEYQRAPLIRKFRAATAGTIPGALDLQRKLLAQLRSPSYDFWIAADLLHKIERHVASLPAHANRPESRYASPEDQIRTPDGYP